MPPALGGDNPETFRWHRVRVDQVAALRADLAGRLAPNTANKVLAAVRGVLKASWRLGLLSAEDFYRCGDVRPVKGGPANRGRCLSKAELRLLFAACGAGLGGRRDAAALACLYGCRRSEPVRLDLADYDPATGRLRVRHAKGNRHRDVYLTNGSKRAVDAWLAVRGTVPGPLLCPVDAFDRVTVRRLHDQTMYEVCKRLAGRAGLARFSPHDLRRTFAGDMLDAGADVALVQRLMGHASVGTTVGYDRRPEEAKRRAAALVGMPLSGQEPPVPPPDQDGASDVDESQDTADELRPDGPVLRDRHAAHPAYRSAAAAAALGTERPELVRHAKP
ncbi:MAG: site-specific integrase [Phycisphaerales bacterium]